MMRNNMPELPEVETVKNTLYELVHNKTISSVKILREKNVLNEPKLFVSSLENQTILDFERVGKFIVFHLSNNVVLISHLRMEGKFFLKDKSEPINKHDLVIFDFTDNTSLRYNDTRRFGILKVSSKDKYMIEPPLSEVGPDALTLNDPKVLQKAFKNKTIAIKTALLDQSIMSGLGNIYVDEVLFACKIHPETPANQVTLKELEMILKESKRILSAAVQAGGTTIKSYHPKEGVSGNFQFALNVYGKKDKPCPRCGHPFRKTFVNGRGTTYCPLCQKNHSLAYSIGITGPVGAGKSLVSKYLEKKGFIYLNSDGIVHSLYKDKNVQKQIKALIPELKIVNGEIDRQHLKNYLLDNPKKKVKLEKFIHAKVSDEIELAIKKAKKSDKFVVEVPLLFESRIDELLTETLLIDINKDKQIANLKTRGEDVNKLIELNKNFHLKENKKKATYVISNNLNAASLYKSLDAIFSCK